MTDQYSWWREAVKGNLGPIHAEEPQSGYYKMRPKNGSPFTLVAIWRDEKGELRCMQQGKPKDPVRTWQSCAGAPVSKADANYFIEHGVWPGDVPEIPSIGHNAPPETIEDQVNAVCEQVDEWLSKHGVRNETSSHTAANYRQQLLDLKKKADTQRASEKKPHDDAAKAVQAKWKPIIDKAEYTAGNLRVALTEWMTAEEKRQREIAAEKARKEREEAERKRAQELAALPPSSPPPPPAVEIAPEPVKVQAGGQHGKRTGLRSIKKAVVVDHTQALTRFANHDDVKELIAKLAREAYRKDGEIVPGVEIVEEKVAA